MKKQSVKLENEIGESLTFDQKEFASGLMDYLCELQCLPRENTSYKISRECLIEYYYTYRFFAREYGWKENETIESYRGLVLKYCFEASTENLAGCIQFL